MGTRWRSWLRPALQVGRSRVRFPMVLLELFIDIMIQPLTEMCTRNISLGGGGVKAVGA
jgi:hypothetical protein